MSQDIVSIELGLPQGDLVTLWAPRWREDGEEWEAFLGHEDDLYAFPDAAHLAAFVRTVDEHDLADHPAWDVVPELSVPELLPDDAHTYDLVGVPELAAEEPDTWTIGELADIVTIVRSLADVCELDEVHEVLNSAAGFSVLEQGTFPFTGREGEKLWTDLAETIAERWDEVLDAIDEVVYAPDVDKVTLTRPPTSSPRTRRSPRRPRRAGHRGRGGRRRRRDTDESEKDTDDDGRADEEEDEPVGFWGEVGIDPVKIITAEGEYYTLRCYLDDEPIFLGTDGQIDVTKSTRALAKHIAQHGSADNDLAEVSTWEEVSTKATDGSLEVEVETDNTYVLNGLADDIGDGPDAVDPVQLDLAVELLTRRGGLGGRQERRRGPRAVGEPRLAGVVRAPARTRPGWRPARRSTPSRRPGRAWSSRSRSGSS